MATQEGEPVLLHVYDLSQGMAQQVSQALLGQTLEGIWHTGVVVFGTEYFFGGGIQRGRPGLTQYGRPVRTIPLGRTEVPLELLEDFLNEIKDRYSMYTYNLMRHNCNHFSNELSTFLTGSGIPADILELPERVLNTPFGQMIAPFIERMETSMRGNQVPSQSLFNAPPLSVPNFAAVRPPPQATPPPQSAPQTVLRTGSASQTQPQSILQTPQVPRRSVPGPSPVVGTPATPHLANLSQTLQTPPAPIKSAPSPATAQELRASSDAETTNSTPGAKLTVPPTGPRAAAAAAAEERARQATASGSVAPSLNGVKVVSNPNGVVNGETSNGAGLYGRSAVTPNVSREVVAKEVQVEFAQVMKEGKLTASQAAAEALARVLKRHRMESSDKKQGAA